MLPIAVDELPGRRVIVSPLSGVSAKVREMPLAPSLPAGLGGEAASVRQGDPNHQR